MTTAFELDREIDELKLINIFEKMTEGQSLNDALQASGLSFYKYKKLSGEHPTLLHDWTEYKKSIIAGGYQNVLTAHQRVVEYLVHQGEHVEELHIEQAIALEKALTKISNDTEELMGVLSGKDSTAIVPANTSSPSEEYIKHLDLQGPHLVRAKSRIEEHTIEFEVAENFKPPEEVTEGELSETEPDHPGNPQELQANH